MSSISASVFFEEQIDGFTYSYTVNIDKNILSISFDDLDRGNVDNLIDFGIYAQKGKISFIDYDNSFYNYSENFGTKKAYVEIYHGDGLETISTLKIEDYSINENTNEVNIDLISYLMEWQKIEVPEIYIYEQTTVRDLIDRVLIAAGFTSDVANNFFVYVGNTEDFLRSIEIYCPRLDKGNLWSVMTKICEVGMCRIYSGKQYNTFCISNINMGIETSSYPIRPSQILSIPTSIPKRKTIISGASLSVIDREKKTGEITPKVSFEIYNFDPPYFGENGFVDTKWNLQSSDGKNGDFFVGKWEGTTDSWDSSFAVSGRLPIDKENVFSLAYPTEELTIFFESISVIWIPSGYTTFSFTFSGDLSSQGQYSSVDNYYIEPNIEGKEIFVSFNKLIGATSSGDRITNASVSCRGRYYVDNEDEVQIYGDGNTIIPSNELMQTYNDYVDSLGERTKYSTKFLETIQGLLSKGTACIELECVLQQPIEKYSIVVPYVIRKGVEQPFLIDENGEPTKFLVLGAKYSYKGILRQTLYLQERHSI